MTTTQNWAAGWRSIDSDVCSVCKRFKASLLSAFYDHSQYSRLTTVRTFCCVFTIDNNHNHPLAHVPKTFSLTELIACKLNQKEKATNSSHPDDNTQSGKNPDKSTDVSQPRWSGSIFAKFFLFFAGFLITKIAISKKMRSQQTATSLHTYIPFWIQSTLRFLSTQ